MKEKFTLLLVIVPLVCFSPGKTFLKELFNSLKLYRIPVLSYAASPIKFLCLNP